MTELLIVVPARGGSKRLPGKNLRLLCGKSLLAHTADAIDASGLLASVILSTDDDAIAAEGERLAWQVPFRRPAELSDDTATTVAAILHVLDWCREHDIPEPKMTMVLQPTSPLRGGACLSDAVELLKSRSDADCVVSMKPINLPPARLYFAGPDGRATMVSENTHRPVYEPNGALYLTRTKTLRNEGTLYGGTILPLIMDHARSVDIDTDIDWAIAEAILMRGVLQRSISLAPLESREGTVN